MRVVTLSGLGQVYVARGPGGMARTYGAGPGLPPYNPSMRARGLGTVGGTVSDALTELNRIVAEANEAEMPEDKLAAIESEAMSVGQALGEDTSRKLTLQERYRVNKLNDRLLTASGAWYKSSWFRFGLVAAAVAGGVYVVYRSYK